jgi:hypothetical protein
MNETTITSGSRPRLRLPVQAAPVYRGRTGAALAGGSSVEASSWIDDIMGVAKTVGDVASTVGRVAGPIGSALGAFGI